MKKLFKVLAGLATGISLGVLFAPEKGKKLRKKIFTSKDKLTIFKETFQEMSQDASAEIKKILRKKEIKNLFSLGKEKFDDVIEKLKEQGEDLSEKAKEEFSTLIDRASEKFDDVKDDLTEKAKKTFKKFK